MKIVLLGYNTVTNGDVDYTIYKDLGDFKYYNILTENEICKAVEDADAILVNRSIISEKVISSAKKLKYVGSLATGYNNIDIAAAKKCGVTVTNVPEYSTEAVASQTVGFILALCLQLVTYNEHVANGGWRFDNDSDCFPFKTYELKGKMLGIFGFGNIGKRVAEIANCLGMKVIFCSKSHHTSNIAEEVDFDTLLKKSDFLTIHAPLNAQTKGVFNKSAFEKMKPSAYLINTARGSLCVEKDLRDALENKIIAGAAIDVVANEPLEDNGVMFGAPNCIITPHVAWGAIETRKRLAEIAYDNLKSFIEGNPKNVVEE